MKDLIMADDKDIPRFFLEQKIASLNTVANVSMTWWVSSVVFCGSIFAAVWVYRKDLFDSGIISNLGIFLSLFFLGIVIFGVLIIIYLRKFYKGMSVISSDFHISNDFSISNELRFFIRAMIVGTLSFALILIGWILLARGLSRGSWMPKEQPNNSLNRSGNSAAFIRET